jgi:hypothetical protein
VEKLKKYKTIHCTKVQDLVGPSDDEQNIIDVIKQGPEKKIPKSAAKQVKILVEVKPVDLYPGSISFIFYQSIFMYRDQPWC